MGGLARRDQPGGGGHHLQNGNGVVARVAPDHGSQPHHGPAGAALCISANRDMGVIRLWQLCGVHGFRSSYHQLDDSPAV